jgi:hypothetical protein
MVAVDDLRNPVPVPPWQPSTADELRRFEAAQARRQLRQEMTRRSAAPSSVSSRMAGGAPAAAP